LRGTPPLREKGRKRKGISVSLLEKLHKEVGIENTLEGGKGRMELVRRGESQVEGRGLSSKLS